MKRSGTKAKYSPMEQSMVYQTQFTTMSEDLLVISFLFSKNGPLDKLQILDSMKVQSLLREVHNLLFRP